MYSAIVLTLAAVAVAEVTQSASSASFSNFETQFLPSTNSLGVVTGQPSLFTSEPTLPAGVTSWISIPTASAAVTGMTMGSAAIGSAGPSASNSAAAGASGSSGMAASGSAMGASGSAMASAAASTAGVEAGSSTAASSGTATGASPSSSTSAGAAAHLQVGGLLGAGLIVAALL